MVRFPWIHRSRKRKTWTLKQRSHVCPEKRAAFGLPARMTHRPAAASASMLEERKKARGCTTFVLVSPQWLSKRMSSSRFYYTWNACPGSTITSPQWDPQRSSTVGSWVTRSRYRKRKQFVPFPEEVNRNTLARIYCRCWSAVSVWVRSFSSGMHQQDRQLESIPAFQKLQEGSCCFLILLFYATICHFLM